MEKKKHELKEERFKKIAVNRTQRILNYLRLLGNCSNQTAYKYREDDVKKIFSTIDSELKRVKQLYANKNQKSEFNL